MLNILLLHPLYYYCKGLADSLKSVNIRVRSASCAADAQKLAEHVPDVLICTVQTLLFLPQINQNLAWEKTQNTANKR